MDHNSKFRITYLYQPHGQMLHREKFRFYNFWFRNRDGYRVLDIDISGWILIG